MADHVPTVILVARLPGLTALSGFRRRPPSRDAARGRIYGAGAVSSVLYLTLLSCPRVAAATVRYAPAGSTTTSRPATIVLQVANAPGTVVEEVSTARRLAGLSGRHGPNVAAVLVTIMFGLLHWMGGGWYIALTAPEPP